jgi:hypothetical protein
VDVPSRRASRRLGVDESFDLIVTASTVVREPRASSVARVYTSWVTRRVACTLLVALAMTAAGQARAEAPTIELVTMGPGDDAFSRFGHAALCVSRGARAARCFNYGTTDFSTPGPLTWAFLRGRARFWLSTVPRPLMLEAYAADERTVYSQVLPLDERAARDLARRVTADLAPEHRTYLYHHFRDNCSTRLRDHVDAVTGGALREGADRPFARTYRDVVREGFSPDRALLVLSEVVPGRALDRRPTTWEAMFLPDVLRAEVARRLGARPETIVARRAPLPRGDPRGGRVALAGGGLGLGAFTLATGRTGRRRLRAAVVGIPLGLLGLALLVLAVVSTLPELRYNELLTVLWPTDLALPALPAALARRYVHVRLGTLAVVALASAAGLFAQPLAAPLLLVAVPFAALAFSRRGPG